MCLKTKESTQTQHKPVCARELYCKMLIPIKGQKSELGADGAGGEPDVWGMRKADAWEMGEVDERGCGMVLVFAPQVSTSAQLNMYTAQVAVCTHLACPLSALVIQLHLKRIEGNENKRIKVVFFYEKLKKVSTQEHVIGWVISGNVIWHRQSSFCRPTEKKLPVCNQGATVTVAVQAG
ncbi:hypothetical protein C8R44DRAFT_724963 [Mycena epipterygia]|nr:hypothetical protein C8R44DRAFT_724963 [Mycena epipterygia]